jgi:hypothetical protein
VQVVKSVVACRARDATQVLATVIETQTVVVASICLLQRVNSIWLHVLGVRAFWQTTLRIVELRVVHLLLNVDWRTASTHLRRLLLR